MITVMGLAALLLSPFGLIYGAIKLKGDLETRRWGMLVLGALCALQSFTAMVYFSMLLQFMGNRGLGV